MPTNLTELFKKVEVISCDRTGRLILTIALLT